MWINNSVLKKDYESIAFTICENLKVERNDLISGMEIRPR